MKYIKIIFFAIVLFLLVVFAHYNQEPTSLIFFSYGGVTYQSFELPLFAFFFIAILIAVIIVSLLEVVERGSLRIKNRRLQKENSKLQAELTACQQREVSPPAEPEKQAEQPEPSAQDKEKKGPTAKKKK
ncbi:MAG: DUF1049 domain-containing protein [Deltaproteobacteria bacterium]|nr:DUF1049 domain-containing protein [Candidatus Zymogenaceae bacterium]